MRTELRFYFGGFVVQRLLNERVAAAFLDLLLALLLFAPLLFCWYWRLAGAVFIVFWALKRATRTP